MRSQFMLALAVSAAAIFMSPSPAHAAESVVKGTGVYRSEQGCLRILPAFARRIESLGLRLTAQPECEEVQGELDAYAPKFEAVADSPTIPETAVAAPLQDEESCRRSLHALIQVVAEPNETIVEASCVPISESDMEHGELVAGQFQPMVFLLKRRAENPAAKSSRKISSSSSATVSP